MDRHFRLATRKSGRLLRADKQALRLCRCHLKRQCAVVNGITAGECKPGVLFARVRWTGRGSMTTAWEVLLEALQFGGLHVIAVLGVGVSAGLHLVGIPLKGLDRAGAELGIGLGELGRPAGG